MVNLYNKNMSYHLLNCIKNLMEAEFLEKDIDFIVNNNDLNERVKKILSIYQKIGSNKISNVFKSNYDDAQISNFK